MLNELLKKSFLNKYLKDYIAVLHIGDYNSRLYMYEVAQNEYKLLGFDSEVLNYKNNVSFIKSLALLINKVQKISKIKIKKIIINVDAKNIELVNYKKTLTYNSSYKHKDLKKLLNFNNYESFLSEDFSLLDIHINSLNFDSYSYQDIKNNIFIKNVSIDFLLIGVKDSYKKSVLSIFNYLDIEVVKIIYDDIALPYFFNKKLSGVFIYFDYNNIVVSSIENDTAINIKTLDYGLNRLFEDIAQVLNLPANIFCNFYQKFLDTINLTNKSFVVSFLNNTYNIDYKKLKSSIDTQFEKFFLEIFTQGNINHNLKNNIYYTGEYNNLLLFNRFFYNEVMNNKLLKEQLNQESNTFDLSVSKIKGISLLKCYLNKN